MRPRERLWWARRITKQLEAEAEAVKSNNKAPAKPRRRRRK